jgi:membrane protease YdiL (CAAX protease family)
MSICLAQDTLPPAAQLIIVAIGLLFVMGLVALVGAHRPRSVLGPLPRNPDGAPWRIAITAVIAGTVWLGLQVAYVGMKAVRIAQTQPGQRFDPTEHLTANDYAVLATVPFVVGFIIMLGLDRVLSRTTLDHLGFTPNRFPHGVALGALGILIVVPLIFCSGMVLEQLYRAVGYEHPTAHELLAVMKQARDPVVRGALIFGAALAAPFFEEYLFRGHIQTFLVGVFTMSRPRPRPRGPTPVPAVEAPPSALAYETPPAVDPENRDAPRVWVAIALTSVLFAIIHPLWTAPLIFVLAMCLGYAYQRTGNLWVPIVIHALFNTFNTIYYLCFS